MKIVTKAQADKVLVDSLFNPVNGQTLRVEKYDCAKYRADRNFIGREIDNASNRIKAIYPVRRRDSDGAYVQLMCVCE